MTEQPPRAIHLAAGEGTRLRPITNDRPKPLVELGGTSLLERNVETMSAAGVDDQLVVTGHCAEQIDALGYETVHNPVRLWEERFDDPLEDAETLRVDSNYAIEEIGNEPDEFEEIDGQYIGLLKIRADHIPDFSEMYYELSEPDTGETRSGVEMTHFIQRLVDDGWAVRGVPVGAGWLEVDTTRDLETYRARFEEGTLDTFVSLSK